MTYTRMLPTDEGFDEFTNHCCQANSHRYSNSRDLLSHQTPLLRSHSNVTKQPENNVTIFASYFWRESYTRINVIIGINPAGMGLFHHGI